MNPFHTIAVPHADILEGRLTMDIFAADLWEVYNKRGPAEYKDAELFFKKTFLTKGLDTLMKVVEKRIRGKGGDSVIQLQTPLILPLCSLVHNGLLVILLIFFFD